MDRRTNRAKTVNVGIMYEDEIDDWEKAMFFYMQKKRLSHINSRKAFIMMIVKDLLAEKATLENGGENQDYFDEDN